MAADTSWPAAERLRLVGRYAVLVLLAMVVLTPIYVTVIGALKPGQAFLDFPRSLLPIDLTLDVLREAWSVGNLDRYLLNSLIVSTLITLGQVVTSVLAAYAFAFLWLPAKRLLFTVFLATLMVPAEAVILSNVLTVQAWGWTDSYRALVVPFLATAFGTFLIRQVFLTIPRDLREAAALDGLGHFRFLWDVAVPIARPAVGALALFAFLSSWNQYLWPQRVTNTDEYRTVQIGLKQLQTANVDQLNLVMAGTVLAALPIFLLLVFFQRQLVRGLTAGAVKG
jgi:sn-glycerol 3-phosphate transport system permease protein